MRTRTLPSLRPPLLPRIIHSRHSLHTTPMPQTSSNPPDLDEKLSLCKPFLHNLLKSHRAAHPSRPFIVGLNGIQGAGKTTLVSQLRSSLLSSSDGQGDSGGTVLPFSIDDLYLPHDAQAALAKSHPANPLWQHRGQPGTHDVQLGAELFDAVKNRRKNVKVPAYDKSAFKGQGDRVAEQEWEVVNRDGQDDVVDVLLFEGWCVGFRALGEEELRRKWEDAVRELKNEKQDEGDKVQQERKKGRLARQRFEDVKAVNDALRGYDVLTDQFDALIHMFVSYLLSDPGQGSQSVVTLLTCSTN